MGRARPAERSSASTARAAALAVLLAAAVSGCGGGSHKQTSTTGTTHSSKTTKPAARVTKPIASIKDVAMPLGDQMQVTVYDLRRFGPFLTLDFGIQCLQPVAGCGTRGDFAPRNEDATQEVTDTNTAAGVSLVDPIGNKRYWPVLDGQQRPDSSLLPGEINDSAIHLAWVTFVAPSTSVSTMDVVLPQGGSVILGVPINTGPPPSASEVGAGAVPATPAQFSQPPSSTNTSGLTLPVDDLLLTAGNPNGSDSESSHTETVTLHTDVLFAFDKSNLTPKARGVLAGVVTQIKSRAVGPVKVTGYTDSIGTDAVNIPLSQARAQSVAGALRPQTPGITYQTAGMGAADPVAPNNKVDGSDNPAGRALNRRVEIHYVG